MTNEEGFTNLMRALDHLIAAHKLTENVDGALSTEIWQAKNVLESSAARYAFHIKRKEWNLSEPSPT